jgi:hypothetical protein
MLKLQTHTAPYEEYKTFHQLFVEFCNSDTAPKSSEAKLGHNVAVI